MSFPWVSREALEQSRDEVAMLRAALSRQLDRYEALFVKYDALAVQAMTPVSSSPTPATVATPTPQSPAPREPSPVAERIRQESGGDPKLASHFWKYAAELKKQGKSPEEIAELIGWTTTDPQPEQTL